MFSNCLLTPTTLSRHTTTTCVYHGHILLQRHLSWCWILTNYNTKTLKYYRIYGRLLFFAQHHPTFALHDAAYILHTTSLHLQHVTTHCPSLSSYTYSRPTHLLNMAANYVRACVCVCAMVLYRFYQRYAELRARIQANSCPHTILPSTPINTKTSTASNNNNNNNSSNNNNNNSTTTTTTATTPASNISSYLVQRSASLKDHRTLR